MSRRLIKMVSKSGSVGYTCRPFMALWWMDESLHKDFIFDSYKDAEVTLSIVEVDDDFEINEDEDWGYNG